MKLKFFLSTYIMSGIFYTSQGKIITSIEHFTAARRSTKTVRRNTLVRPTPARTTPARTTPAPTTPAPQEPITEPDNEDIDSLNDYLNLKGNLSMDGTIRANKYVLTDGSQLSSGQSSFPSNISFDSQGNMTLNGNLAINGTIIMNGKPYTLVEGTPAPTTSTPITAAPTTATPTTAAPTTAAPTTATPTTAAPTTAAPTTAAPTTAAPTTAAPKPAYCSKGIYSNKSSDNLYMRLYTDEECKSIGGSWIGNGETSWGMNNNTFGECLKNEGGSYSAECSTKLPFEYMSDASQNNNKTYTDIKNLCTGSTQLCATQDLCPNNKPLDNLKTSFNGKDNWMAVSDSDNEWITYWDNSNRLCQTHTQIAGSIPAWGTANTQSGDWTRVGKCCEIPVLIGVNTNKDIYYATNNFLTDPKWKNYSTEPLQKLTWISYGKGQAFGVDASASGGDSIWYTSDYKSGKWVKLPGGLVQISFDASANVIMGVNRGYEIYYANQNITSNPNWTKVPGGLTNVCVSNSQAYGVNSAGQIYYNANYTTGNWIQTSGILSKVSFDGYKNIVVGINASGSISYANQNVNTATPTWVTVPMPNDIKLTNICYYNGQTICVDGSSNIYYSANYKKPPTKLPNGLLSQVSLG